MADNFANPLEILGQVSVKDVGAVLDRMGDKTTPQYKARPLNGIWATAPYLHNGSIPNLEQLLKPYKERDKHFYVGSRRFDPVRVGLSTEKDGLRDFLFDTTKPGNLNTGHDWTVAPEHRQDLIEYLKTL